MGVIDHFDSFGNSGRYGDVQWMVAGNSIQHAEMFPLIETDKPNPFEIVQIWLNMPKRLKMGEPAYQMHWRETIPVVPLAETNPAQNHLKVLVGRYDDAVSGSAPASSYGFEDSHHINIWDGQIEAGTQFEIPPYPADVKVQLYVMSGNLTHKDSVIPAKTLLVYTDDEPTTFEATADTTFMVFIGQTIDEPVFAYGPFVMTTRAEVEQAYANFEVTQFGGWPWDSHDPKIAAEQRRFSQLKTADIINYPPLN